MKTNQTITQLGTLKSSLQEKGRILLGETLGLTGSEISFNYTQKGQFVPFVHTHQRNEEVYIVLSGSGKFFLDGDEFQIQEGTVIRVSPTSERAIAASQTEDIFYICIQTEADSLQQATMDDGVLTDTKASWMKN